MSKCKYDSGLLIIEKWEGRKTRISPYGLKFRICDLEDNNELYKEILCKTRTLEALEFLKNEDLKIVYGELPHFEKILKEREQLLKDIEGSRIEITIKVKLVKYE